jgi:hypothetical protein
MAGIADVVSARVSAILTAFKPECTAEEFADLLRSFREEAESGQGDSPTAHLLRELENSTKGTWSPVMDECVDRWLSIISSQNLITEETKQVFGRVAERRRGALKRTRGALEEEEANKKPRQAEPEIQQPEDSKDAAEEHVNVSVLEDPMQQGEEEEEGELPLTQAVAPSDDEKTDQDTFEEEPASQVVPDYMPSTPEEVSSTQETQELPPCSQEVPP